MTVRLIVDHRVAGELLCIVDGLLAIVEVEKLPAIVYAAIPVDLVEVVPGSEDEATDAEILADYVSPPGGLD